LHDLSISDPVRLQSPSGAGWTWAARLTRLAPESDPQARTLTAYAEVEQSDQAEAYGTGRDATLLLPGMFVEAVVTSRRTEPRFVVPRRSVRSGRVMVVADGTLDSRPVQ